MRKVRRLSDYTVTVLGATGKTGWHVASESLARGWAVRAATRRPPGHSRWEPFDWDDPARWPSAFRGSHAAYLVIPFNHPGAPEAAPHLIRAVAAAGVARVVLLSSLDAEGAAPDSPLRMAEEALAASSVRWAALRPTWFLDNFTTGSFADMTRAGELRLPAGDAKIPFIDAHDVAAVAAACMAESGPEGILPLTGPEAIDHHDVARALATALRRPVSYMPVAAGEFVEMMTRRGFPHDYAVFLADALAGVEAIPVSDTVARVCGRPPFSAAEFARQFAA